MLHDVQAAKKKDPFYLKPQQNVSNQKSWYSVIPMGKTSCHTWFPTCVQKNTIKPEVDIDVKDESLKAGIELSFGDLNNCTEVTCTSAAELYRVKFVKTGLQCEFDVFHQHAHTVRSTGETPIPFAKFLYT